MLSKRYRLRKNYEFNHVYRKGQSCACREMVLYSAKSSGAKIRVGFVAGKKVGKSVKRSRAKRLMREAVRSVFTQYKLGYNYIIVARCDILKSSFEQIKRSMLYMLKKIG